MSAPGAESTTNTASKTYEPENPNPIKGFVQAVSGAGEKIIGKLSKSGSHGDHSPTHTSPSAASASTNNNDDNNNSDNMATQAQFSASTANHPADAGPGAAPEGEDLGERYEQANRDLNRE